MIQQEFNMDIEIKVPPRPKIDRTIIEEAAKNLTKDNPVFTDFGEDAWEDIANEYSYPSDGYEIAKRLDDYYCWDMDMQIAEELDGMDHEVQTILHKAEKAWVTEFNIQPSLPIGTEIKEGVIEGVCNHSPARYLVKRHGETRPNCHLLIKFEDAAPVG